MLKIWSAVGERLHWAMERQRPEGTQGGMRLFVRRIEQRSEELVAAGEKKIVGIGLSSLKDYVAGRAEPNLRFLREAAKLLEVRSQWLICNQGPPVEAFETRPADVPTAPEPGFDLERTLAKAVCRGIGLPESNQRSWYRAIAAEERTEIPAQTPLFEEIPFWVSPLLQVRLRLRDLDIRLDPASASTAYRIGDHSAEDAVAEGIGGALAAPLSKWAVDPTRMGEETLADYILSMVPALILLAHERNRQRLEDVEKERRK